MVWGEKEKSNEREVTSWSGDDGRPGAELSACRGWKEPMRHRIREKSRTETAMLPYSKERKGKLLNRAEGGGVYRVIDRREES